MKKETISIVIKTRKKEGVQRPFAYHHEIPLKPGSTLSAEVIEHIHNKVARLLLDEYKIQAVSNAMVIRGIEVKPYKEEEIQDIVELVREIAVKNNIAEAI